MNATNDFGFKCQCAAGYGGTTCSDDINECSSDPCLHAAACRESGDTPIPCKTSPAWAANNTEKCGDPVPADAFQCSCVGGYVGDTCHTCQSVLTLSCSVILVPVVACGSILVILGLAYKVTKG